MANVQGHRARTSLFGGDDRVGAA